MSEVILEAEKTSSGNYWQWQGHQIFYVKAGQKKSNHPPLLLVHGFGASTDHWRQNIAQLQEHFEVWAIDLLGFGRSQKPNLQYSGNLWREQLHDFITEMIGEPVVLAGNSLGGYASLCMAALKRELVKGLILLNSAGPFSDSQTSQPSLGSKIRRALFRQPWLIYFIFQYTRRKSIIRKTLEQVYLDKTAVTEQLIADIYRPSCDPGAFKVFASVFTSPSGEKVDVLLEQLQCPLLMLWGEGDPWIQVREKGAKFRQYYPDLTEYYLNAGHCPHDEIPEQVNSLIQDWVRENCS